MNETTTAETGEGAVPLSWEGEYPLLKNKTVLFGLLGALGFGTLLLFMVLTGITVAEGDYDRLPAMVGMTAILGGFILLLCLFVMVVFFGGKMAMRVEVGEDAVTQTVISKRAKWANALAIAAGLFGGARGATTAGAGLIAKSRETETVALADLREAVGNPATGEIRLRNESRTVMQVYAPKERYEEILGRLRQGIAANAAGEARRDIPDLAKVGVVFGALFFGAYLLVPFPLGFSAPFVVVTVVLTILMVTARVHEARPVIGWMLAGGIAVSVFGLLAGAPPDWNEDGIGMALALQLGVIGLFFVAGVMGGMKWFNYQPTRES